MLLSTPVAAKQKNVDPFVERWLNTPEPKVPLLVTKYYKKDKVTMYIVVLGGELINVNQNKAIAENELKARIQLCESQLLKKIKHLTGPINNGH